MRHRFGFSIAIRPLNVCKIQRCNFGGFQTQWYFILGMEPKQNNKIPMRMKWAKRRKACATHWPSARNRIVLYICNDWHEWLLRLYGNLSTRIQSYLSQVIDYMFHLAKSIAHVTRSSFSLSLTHSHYLSPSPFEFYTRMFLDDVLGIPSIYMLFELKININIHSTLLDHIMQMFQYVLRGYGNLFHQYRITCAYYINAKRSFLCYANNKNI